jgi:hypothetical protein
MIDAMPVAIAVGIGATVALGLLSAFQWKRHLKRTRARLRAEWGQPKASHAIGEIGVYHFHPSNQSGDSLDSTTWADLNLDAVFRFLDRNESALGRERLYHRLRRTSGCPSDVRAFDRTVERLRTDESARVAIQMALATITETHDRTVWELALNDPEPLPRWLRVACPTFAAAMVAVSVVTILKPAFLGLAAAAVALSLLMRARMAWRIYPSILPFRSVSQIVRAARRVAECEPAAEPATAVLTTHLPTVASLARLSGLIGRDPSRTDIVTLLWDYLSILFCVDGNALLLGQRTLRRCQRELRTIAETLGDLDAAISIASVRAGVAEWTPPEFIAQSSAVEAIDLRHPLVSPCVPNSVTLGPPAGVVLTGANMTGKSTFLRSVGVNAVLAQTVGTVFATTYHTPWLAVRTCISPTDDLEAGKSLYQREAETVVSIIGQAANGGILLCLFDELFRGTNSADRIGASAAVFNHLAATGTPSAGRRCLVMAATHDLELVDVVGEGFCSYYFGDRIVADRLEFDYRLRPGVAPSRNAVALLRLFGAPPSLVAEALETAGRVANRGSAAVPSR